MKCLDSDMIARLALGENVGDDEAVAHAANCPSCARCIQVTRDALLADVTASVIAEEEELVRELLAVPVRRRATVALRDRYARVSLARRFSVMAIEEWGRDLNVALEHAQVATAISSHLERSFSGAAEVQFEAWKNRSTIHRNRGEYDAARAALKRAEMAVPRCADVELKQAIVAFADACICTFPDVWEPSQALAGLDCCEPVFARRNDRNRLLSAATLRGKIHLLSGEYAAALAVYGDVLSKTRAGDEVAAADARRNVANALIRVGRLDDAEAELAAVRLVDERYDRTAPLVRDDALLAFARDERGLHDEAAELFAQASERFAAIGDTTSALMAGKDRVIALVAADRAGEARVILTQLLRQAVIDGDNRKRYTAEALAYLRELATREQLTIDVAKDVSSYIDRIFAQRATPFIPPISLHTM